MNRTSLPELACVLRTLGTYGHRLDPATATPEQLAIITRAVNEARHLVAAAQGPAPLTGCGEHPAGPVDPTDGRCLLCRPRRHRSQAAAAAPTTDVQVEDIVQAVAELGEQEAVRRYGGRAVTRATAAAGRGTHRYPPNERPTRRNHEESTA
ncbi:hypothetical protein ACGFR8_07660 [Streptomyces brevispora]|uniref:hypothetical protein n=1 Tax=Streptomyces brevispora TaxID=887462 RepID=UPI00371D632B